MHQISADAAARCRLHYHRMFHPVHSVELSDVAVAHTVLGLKLEFQEVPNTAGSIATTLYDNVAEAELNICILVSIKT